jgi:hypothetical protein
MRGPTGSSTSKDFIVIAGARIEIGPSIGDLYNMRVDVSDLNQTTN